MLISCSRTAVGCETSTSPGCMFDNDPGSSFLDTHSVCDAGAVGAVPISALVQRESKSRPFDGIGCERTLRRPPPPPPPKPMKGDEVVVQVPKADAAATKAAGKAKPANPAKEVDVKVKAKIDAAAKDTAKSARAGGVGHLDGDGRCQAVGWQASSIQPPHANKKRCSGRVSATGGFRPRSRSLRQARQ